jgi:hypothetical protein
MTKARKRKRSRFTIDVGTATTAGGFGEGSAGVIGDMAVGAPGAIADAFGSDSAISKPSPVRPDAFLGLPPPRVPDRAV